MHYDITNYLVIQPLLFFQAFKVFKIHSAMPIRSPKGDLGPLGDFLVKIGPLLVPFYTKSPFSSRL